MIWKWKVQFPSGARQVDTYQQPLKLGHENSGADKKTKEINNQGPMVLLSMFNVFQAYQ
jgi:hypothetical protein